MLDAVSPYTRRLGLLSIASRFGRGGRDSQPYFSQDIKKNPASSSTGRERARESSGAHLKCFLAFDVLLLSALTDDDVLRVEVVGGEKERLRCLKTCNSSFYLLVWHYVAQSVGLTLLPLLLPAPFCYTNPPPS